MCKFCKQRAANVFVNLDLFHSYHNHFLQNYTIKCQDNPYLESVRTSIIGRKLGKFQKACIIGKFWSTIDSSLVERNRNEEPIAQLRYWLNSNSKYNYHLKHCLCLCVWKIQHSGTRLEINTARGEAECCIYLSTCPIVLYVFSVQTRGSALSTVIYNTTFTPLIKGIF